MGWYWYWSMSKEKRFSYEEDRSMMHEDRWLREEENKYIDPKPERMRGEKYV